MGYLLVVLAVVLVPVVAQNQSHVPSTSSSCPAAVKWLSFCVLLVAVSYKIDFWSSTSKVIITDKSNNLKGLSLLQWTFVMILVYST